jgi:hypothetical protein
MQVSDDRKRSDYRSIACASNSDATTTRDADRIAEELLLSSAERQVGLPGVLIVSLLETGL